MLKLTCTTRLFAVAAAGAMAWSASATAAEVNLRTIASLPVTFTVTKSFLTLFVPKATELGKGQYKIDFKGGPEVIPARKGAVAVKRGTVEMLWGPAGYYAGTVPEAYAMMGSHKKVGELWANGALDLLNEIWAKKLNARILAWGESETQMHVYTMFKPKITANGPDLTGKKMRTSPTYKLLLSTLGATPIRMPSPEIYTGLQRGVIDGFAFPVSGVTQLGVGRIIKYRVDPGFYRNNSLVIINLDAWKKISKKGKDALNTAARHYEKVSLKFMTDDIARELKVLDKYGMKVFTLKGATAKKYIEIADDAMWKRLDKLVKGDTSALKAKFR
jgi:TRAP-type C4-dicarboxylate transport system substrate-binding protein